MANSFEGRLSNGMLKLIEWESLCIEEDYNYKSLKGRISPDEGEYIEKLDIFDYHGKRIKAKHFVGAMGFDKPIGLANNKKLEQIIIKPKVGMAKFINMIEVAYQVKLPELKPEAELDKKDDLRVILALIYIKTVEELLKRHLRRHYVIIVDRLNSKVKGKLLLKTYLRENLARGMPHISVCQFYELTPDTLLNRIVKAGLRISQRLLHQSYSHTHFRDTLSGEASRFIGLLAGVSDVRITVADFARIRLHSQNRHYEPALKIARLLILCQHPAQEVGGCKVRGFFLDMNDLFERFVAGLLKLAGYGYAMEFQKAYGYKYICERDERRRTLRPDIVLKLQHGNIIIDTKYKDLFEGIDSKDDFDTGEEYGKTKIKIRPSDIYQMVSYLDNTGSGKGVLVYPKDDIDISSPIKVTGFSDKEIHLVGFGLENIPSLIKRFKTSRDISWAGFEFG